MTKLFSTTANLSLRIGLQTRLILFTFRLKSNLHIHFLYSFANLCRYILKAKYYRDEKPFINVENAYFNIAFSCVSYLNTCLELESNERRYMAEVVVQGLHGLQLYANQYWYRHIISYVKFCVKNQLRISEELVSQLSALLQLQKNKIGGPKSVPLASLPPATLDLNSLNQIPLVKGFVLEVISFRESLGRDHTSDKPAESKSSDYFQRDIAKYYTDVSSNSCDADPTHLSTIRNNYLLTTEALLSQNAQHMFPTLNQKMLETFAETYGGSAFVCRILRCPFSTDGFSTSQQRDNHELQHRPKLRCGNANCFSMGFTTRSQLNRHIEKYHPVGENETSLVDAIRSLNIESPLTPQKEKEIKVLADVVSLQQNTNSCTPTATQQIQQLIYQTLKAQTGPATGWKSQLLIQERVGLILSM